MSAYRRGNRETSEPGQAGFHYNREERLGEREQRTAPEGGIFRRNRGLLIILLDIVIVLIMFMLYLFFLRPDPGILRIDRYQVQANAFRFAQSVYATIEISLSREMASPGAPPAGDGSGPGPLGQTSSGAPEGADTLVRVGFPDGTRVTDVLPSGSEFPTTIRHVMEADALDPGDGGEGAERGEPAPDEIMIRVELADTSRTLQVRVSEDGG